MIVRSFSAYEEVISESTNCPGVAAVEPNKSTALRLQVITRCFLETSCR